MRLPVSLSILLISSTALAQVSLRSGAGLSSKQSRRLALFDDWPDLSGRRCQFTHFFRRSQEGAYDGLPGNLVLTLFSVVHYLLLDWNPSRSMYFICISFNVSVYNDNDVILLRAERERGGDSSVEQDARSHPF